MLTYSRDAAMCIGLTCLLVMSTTAFTSIQASIDDTSSFLNQSVASTTRTVTNVTTTMNATAVTSTVMQYTTTTSQAFLECNAPVHQNGVYRPFQRGAKGEVFVWQVLAVGVNNIDVPLYVRSSKSNSSTVLASKFNGDLFEGYEVGDWIELVSEQGYAMRNDESSSMTLLKVGVQAFWRLQCFSGYSPTPSAGDFAFCQSSGLLSQPQPSCTRDAGCYGKTAPLHDSNSRTGCPYWMPEGGACKVECSAEFAAFGSFRCSRGEMVGQSVCFQKGVDVFPDAVKRIAGTFRMRARPEPDEFEVLRALSIGFLIPESSVVNLKLMPVVGDRRLKGGRTLTGDLFQVKYEIHVPDDDAGVVLRICYELARTNSTVQRRFQSELMSPSGVEVDGIETVIAAREIESFVFRDSNGTEIPLRKTLTELTPESQSDVYLIVGVSGALLLLCVCCCAVQYYFLMQRKANA
mmetsp:Transcript_16705/g.27011  ORF Transcript_16705/g.27011 Transcript_16705/m.27011 type:complete len:463 (-) Transcript_16705:425-1813(-)